MPDTDVASTTGTGPRTGTAPPPVRRAVVLYCLMSLDGAVEDPGRYFTPAPGAGDTPQFDEQMDENENAIIGRQDEVLLGRRTYDEWSRYWPTVVDHPFADFINSVKKYVVTSTPLTTPWHNSEVVDGPVAHLLQDLRSRSGGDIGIHGSIQLAQSLLSAGLVDELQLVVGPAIHFPGRRLLSGPENQRRLELLSARSTPSGSLLLSYRMSSVVVVQSSGSVT